MKNIIIDMKLVFVAILLAMFAQTLTSGIAIYAMWDSFIAMSVVVLFHSLLNNIYLHLYQHLLMQLLSAGYLFVYLKHL